MNWLINKVKPLIKKLPGGKKSLGVGEDAWIKCNQCQTMLYAEDLKKTINVCPTCDFHLKIHPRSRLKHLFDDGKFEEIKYESRFIDPLNFRDSKTYKERWHEARKKSGLDEVFLIGYGKINDIRTTVAAMSWQFMGGSVGPAGAEAMVKAAEHSVTSNTPLVVFTCSGGMRMQTSMLSLQALPKTTIAVQMVKDAKLPYIVCFCDATSGGVSASFGSLGDITIAEPNALICFAGPRVIQSTVGETLPEGFQRSEFLKKNGFIDQIVHRSEIKNKLTQILSLLLKRAA